MIENKAWSKTKNAKKQRTIENKKDSKQRRIEAWGRWIVLVLSACGPCVLGDVECSDGCCFPVGLCSRSWFDPSQSAIQPPSAQRAELVGRVIIFVERNPKPGKRLPWPIKMAAMAKSPMRIDHSLDPFVTNAEPCTDLQAKKRCHHST